jgi:hypothetical protein
MRGIPPADTASGVWASSTAYHSRKPDEKLAGVVTHPTLSAEADKGGATPGSEITLIATLERQ